MSVARNRTVRLYRLALVFALLALGSVPTATGASSSDPTVVVILGTLHGYHDQCRDYSRSVLRDLIIGVEPSVILFEMPPTIGGEPTAVDGRIDDSYQSNEAIAVNQAADALDVPAVPYDRDRRNERYQELRYFEREQFAFTTLMEWALNNGSDSIASAVSTAMGCLLETIQGSQMDMAIHAGPRVVNSSAFDRLSENTRCLVYDLVPSLLANAEMDTVLADLTFFSEEWSTRNTIMADNIETIASEHPGQRIVVLCGAEHRYILRTLLQGRAGIEVKEYYEME